MMTTVKERLAVVSRIFAGLKFVRNDWVLVALVTLTMITAPAAFGAPAGLSISPSGYEILSVTIVGPARFEILARPGIENSGPTAFDVTARLSNAPSNITILDGDVTFGALDTTAPGTFVRSVDTLKLSVLWPDPILMSQPVPQFAQGVLSNLSWQISCEGCGNRPPLASAGPDQTVTLQQNVTLDGSASTDPDNDSLGFAWSIASAPANSTARLSDPSALRPLFTPDVAGTYAIQLVVNDGKTNSAPAIVTLTTVNSSPVARAGTDQSTRVSSTVLLDGSGSSDVDGDPLIYEWSLVEVPEASAASVSGQDLAQPLASFVVDKPGRYVAQLIVRDPDTASTPDTAVISTINARPQAAAGSDQTVNVGQTVQLSAAGSSDPDNDTLTFRWSLTTPTASATTLNNAEGPDTSFSVDVPGDYLVQLIVNDGQENSEPDTLVISTVNSSPIAVAGPDELTALVGQQIQLDGSGSTDPDGDDLSFGWSLIAFPLESGATLQNANTPHSYFVPDEPGTYVVQLIVSDGHIDSSPSTSRVVVEVAQDGAPKISVTFPTEGQYVNRTSIVLEGDLDRPASLTIDGVPVVFSHPTHFSHPKQLADGLNEITLIAQDAQTHSTLIRRVHVDREPPAAPNESLITVRQGGEGELIVSGRAGAVEPYARVSVFSRNGGASVIADASGAFSVTIRGQPDDVLYVDQVDRAGNPNEEGLTTSFLSGLNFRVESLNDYAQVELPVANLIGELRGPLDAALSADGIPAAITGTGFERTFRVSVPLQDGLNTISLVATTADGLKLTRLFHLERTGHVPFAIEASSAEGIAPLQVTFEIKRFDATVIRRVEIDFEGRGPLDVAEDSSRPGPFEHTYSTPGQYEARFYIETSDGEGRHYPVLITVHRSSVIDSRALVTWNNFTAALRASSPQVALSQMTEECAGRYGPLLTALQDTLTAIAETTSAPQLVGVYGNIAEYAVARTVNGEQSSYLIYFLRGNDGVWRIASL